MQFHVDYIGDWCVDVYMILNITEVQIIARARKIYFINICVSLIVRNGCIKLRQESSGHKSLFLCFHCGRLNVDMLDLYVRS
jgi:hypothetical protein